jgi:hypothetical protein
LHAARTPGFGILIRVAVAEVKALELQVMPEADSTTSGFSVTVAHAAPVVAPFPQYTNESDVAQVALAT